MQDFVTLCPSLLYQLTVHSCHSNINVHDTHTHSDGGTDHAHDIEVDDGQSVWQAPSAQGFYLYYKLFLKSKLD